MSAPSRPACCGIPFRLLLPFLLLSLFASGCAPLVRGEQPAQPEQILLSSGEALGQSFTARYAGLSGIEIYLAPEAPGDGQLLLELRSGLQEGDPLGQAELPLRSIDTPGFYRFQLPPQSGSARGDYFASLQPRGSGSVWAGVAPGDAYLNGSLYRGQDPQDAQLAFRLVYAPRQLSWGLFGEILGWLWSLVAGGLLFVIPGWAILDRLLPGWPRLAWGEQLGLAAGASLAIYPLLFLWTHLAGFNLGLFYAWGPALAGLGLLVFPLLRSRPSGQAGRSKVIQRARAWLLRLQPVDLAWFFLALLVFATRFWVVSGLDVPLWGDSYQHTMITQLLVDHGGLFRTWAPYAELQTFTYHFGFHTLAAVFHWITRLPPPQAVLWTGQILNGLAVLALYPLAVRFGRNRWAGVAAILVAGLLAQMPMYYLNWGRYTELAGLAILPAAIYLVDRLLSPETVEAEKGEPGEAPGPQVEAQELPGQAYGRNQNINHWLRFAGSDLFKILFLAWIVLGGLALTHYRVLVIAVLFLPAAFLVRLQPKRARLAALKILATGAGAGLLFLPWFIRLFSGRILQVFSGLVTTPVTQVPASVADYNVIGDLEAYLPGVLWLLVLAAFACGIWRRERAAILLGLWWLLVVLAANPHWLGLPGQGALSNFAVFIAVYLPAGVLLGVAASWGWRETNRFGWIALLLCLALGLWGARERLRDVDIAGYALVTRPDLRAAGWIQANTPQSSRFLVNSFLAYGDTLVAGSDAGWWLPLLAGRATTLPPINYSSEQWPRPDYLEWTNALTEAIQEFGLESPQVIAMLKERGVTHVFIGQRDGRVGNPGPALLQAGQLSESPNFQLVYHEDRVWVFEFLE